MEALFLEHEGYFGALGAFLISQNISHKDQGLFQWDATTATANAAVTVGGGLIDQVGLAKHCLRSARAGLGPGGHRVGGVRHGLHQHRSLFRVVFWILLLL